MSTRAFLRIATAVPELKVANCFFNAEKIADIIHQANDEKVEVLCFPELSITSYTCADLFFQQQLLEDAKEALSHLVEKTAKTAVTSIVGMPLRVNNQLFNTAVVFQCGKIVGVVPKTHIPNNFEYYEKRWFASGIENDEESIVLGDQTVPFGLDLLFSAKDFTFGIEICEDVWNPIPPSTQQALHGAEVIFNLSASNDLIGKHAYRLQLIEQQSARCIVAYAYASSGVGESSTDLVFGGHAMIAENGSFIAKGERFSRQSQLVVADIDLERLHAERIRNSNFNNNKSGYRYRKITIPETQKTPNDLQRYVNPYPFVPSDANKKKEVCEEIFAIQTSGLAKRWQHSQVEHLVLGISGGLDSTLALLVCVKTADLLQIDRKKIVGITMPGFGTTNRTYDNAVQLMKMLGITIREISIADACRQHFNDIGHDENVHDITFENTQARERTQILMDVANQCNGMVVGTGDMSELALGWATYNGDHMSMYAVNTSIPKTLVRYLVEWAESRFDEKTQTVLEDILQTPVSPELLPADEQGNIAQKTEDIVGPYELHDFFLFYLVRFGFRIEKIELLAQKAFKGTYSDKEINKWLKIFIRRFFIHQFKRSCMPDGPKVGNVNLSPRGDWRMPSDADAFLNN